MSWLAKALLAFSIVLFLSTAPRAEPAEFIVLGDIPYGADHITSLNYISRVIGKGGYPFVVHYGDIRAGDTFAKDIDCSDDALTARRDVIYGLLKGRVFYTPGDNDWTDCDREAGGWRDEVERLKVLRKLFFTDGLPSEPGWQIARQAPDYPENARWEWGGLQFVTLHIVGTDNGREEIEKPGNVEEALDAVDLRDQANLAWLDAAFDQAQLRGVAGLVAVMQADPYDIEHHDQRSRPCSPALRTHCNPYLEFLQRLTERADRFDKPVLLIHGSTNQFCLDRGFGGWRAPKLWRLNGPGDFVTIDAAVVGFDPGDLRQPFTVGGLLSGDSPPDCR